MSSTERTPPEREEQPKPKKKTKSIVRPSKVNLSILSTHKSSTEHDRQNSSKRAPGPVGTMEGGRPPGSWGSMVQEIYREESQGVLVTGTSRVIGQFLKLAYSEMPEVRWVARDAPSAVTWVRQRREIHSAAAYLASAGMNGEVAEGLDSPVPLEIEVKFEDVGINTSVTIENHDLAAAMRKSEKKERKREAREASGQVRSAEEQAKHDARKAQKKLDNAENYPGTTPRDVEKFLEAVLDTVDALLQEGDVKDSELTKLMQV